MLVSKYFYFYYCKEILNNIEIITSFSNTTLTACKQTIKNVNEFYVTK